jgi:hypothetical protein
VIEISTVANPSRQGQGRGPRRLKRTDMDPSQQEQEDAPPDEDGRENTPEQVELRRKFQKSLPLPRWTAPIPPRPIIPTAIIPSPRSRP